MHHALSVRIAVSLALALGACAPAAATGPRLRPVDVAAVRREIRHEMAHDWTAAGRFKGERAIVSMGHVTEQLAVVYTDVDGKRYEETWVKGAGGWQLQRVEPV